MVHSVAITGYAKQGRVSQEGRWSKGFGDISQMYLNLFIFNTNISEFRNKSISSIKLIIITVNY